MSWFLLERAFEDQEYFLLEHLIPEWYTLCNPGNKEKEQGQLIFSNERMVVCNDFHNHPASVLSLNSANVYRLEVTCQNFFYKARHKATDVAALMECYCEIF